MVAVYHQAWLIWTMGCTPVGTCRWTGSKSTCRHSNSSPKRQGRSPHESWRPSMYRSTSLLWWGRFWWHTHTQLLFHLFPVAFLHLISDVFQGFSLFLGLLGAHPSQILLHRLWLSWVSLCFMLLRHDVITVCLNSQFVNSVAQVLSEISI